MRGRGCNQRLSAISHEKPVYAAQESLNAFNAGVLPVEIAVGRSGEQAIQACGIGTVTRDHLVGRDYVAQILRHLAAFFDYHALGKEALDRFVVGDHAEIAHELRPEARIDQVQDCVLDAADVLINTSLTEPVLGDLAVKGRMIVLRVRVAVEVPGGIHEGVHGVGFAARGTATLWTRGIYKYRHPLQG